MSSIRLCRDNERTTILAIVNAAAEAYRGVIPEDCWHEPYMPLSELQGEIAAGVAFWGYETEDTLVGVMGVQPVRDVDLIRHAYVLPADQRHGVGGALLEHLQNLSTRRMLVGTWAAADWAIRFYCRHGFELASPARKTEFTGCIRYDRNSPRKTPYRLCPRCLIGPSQSSLFTGNIAHPGGVP